MAIPLTPVLQNQLDNVYSIDSHQNVTFEQYREVLRFLKGLTLGGGTGDVVGPGISTNNAIAVFNGTTGKLLLDSLVTISGGGSMNLPAGSQYLINGVPVTAGLSIVPITYAALSALIGGFDTTVIYQITDAGSATTGVNAVLNIMAFSASELQAGGQGTFSNANTPAVECRMTYDIATNFITSVEESIYNNKVYGGIRTSSATQEQSVIASFRFADPTWRDNVFNGCQWTNFTTGSFKGCLQTCTWINFNGFDTDMTNQFMQGVSNQLSGVPDITITGTGTELECNDFWGNDSDGTLKNLGRDSEVSYVRIGWFSLLDMNNIVSADFRFNNIGSTAHVLVNTDQGIRYCEFGNGVNVELDGLTLSCSFIAGNQGGDLSVLKFHGSKSTLIACNYGTNEPDVLTCNNSILINTTVSASGNTGAGNLIDSCLLTKCVVDFADFTGCSIIGVSASNHTFTFTANNQTIGSSTVVPLFANVAARDAAITLPIEGMIVGVASDRFYGFVNSGWNPLS